MSVLLISWMAAWRCSAVASFHMCKNVEWKLERSVLLLLIKGLTVPSVDVPDKWFSFDNTGFTQSHQQNFSIFPLFNLFWPSILCVQAGSWCCFYFSALLPFPHLSVRPLVLCAAMESQHDNTACTWPFNLQVGVCWSVLISRRGSGWLPAFQRATKQGLHIIYVPQFPHKQLFPFLASQLTGIFWPLPQYLRRTLDLQLLPVPSDPRKSISFSVNYWQFPTSNHGRVDRILWPFDGVKGVLHFSRGETSPGNFKRHSSCGGWASSETGSSGASLRHGHVAITTHAAVLEWNVSPIFHERNSHFHEGKARQQTKELVFPAINNQTKQLCRAALVFKDLLCLTNYFLLNCVDLFRSRSGSRSWRECLLS